jgi:NADH:quinone reductase (non-electrogenic)
MADIRSLLASLFLDSDGINMGARFIATKEALVHDNVKQTILEAKKTDTRLVAAALFKTRSVF